ncbi:SDR family NAD(P)-dependent oxidoreductase [Kineococcus indalonis]|uniref:SDR family NAD(P)-dependent oxidoreductase n=1 Tax=Kineococcus indalonis TaxID=2696566 RepID=UPI001412BDD5|nr:SDR family NAD(P)-dependent oxidoreductase [Kineococcus indalonis]NAZ85727.1 SDR family NAD(P)-dependent oxidoreductase [Kineococcus indalonis]
MPTIAIIGAGPGLGAAAGRRFGREGFHVALIARDEQRLRDLATQLSGEGLTVAGYPADVRDRTALQQVLERAGRELGTIEVLQYSPIPHQDFLRPLLDTGVEELTAAVEFSVLGPVTAVRQVLPGMRALGRGTILFVNGGSAVRPNARVAGTSIAFAAEGAYAQMLHGVLAAEGIGVHQLIVPGAIRAGDADNDPDLLADTLWTLHTTRGGFRTFSSPMPSA